MSNLAFRVDAVHPKYRLGNVETDGDNRLHDWLLRIVGALYSTHILGPYVPARSRHSIKSRHWTHGIDQNFAGVPPEIRIEEAR